MKRFMFILLLLIPSTVYAGSGTIDGYTNDLGYSHYNFYYTPNYYDSGWASVGRAITDAVTAYKEHQIQDEQLEILRLQKEQLEKQNTSMDNASTQPAQNPNDSDDIYQAYAKLDREYSNISNKYDALLKYTVYTEEIIDGMSQVNDPKLRTSISARLNDIKALAQSTTDANLVFDQLDKLVSELKQRAAPTEQEKPTAK